MRVGRLAHETKTKQNIEVIIFSTLAPCSLKQEPRVMNYELLEICFFLKKLPFAST